MATNCPGPREHPSLSRRHSDEKLADLRRRVARDTLAQRELVTDSSQGVQSKMLQEAGALLGEKSTTGAKVEKKLNAPASGLHHDRRA